VTAVVGVLALQGDFEAHAKILAGLGAEAREVRVPADLVGLDALVMPGGHHFGGGYVEIAEQILNRLPAE